MRTSWGHPQQGGTVAGARHTRTDSTLRTQPAGEEHAARTHAPATHAPVELRGQRAGRHLAETSPPPPATSPGPDRDTRTHGMQPANQYLRARMFERSTHWQCPPRRSKQGVEMQATHSSQPVLNQSIKCWHVLRFAAFHSRAMSTPKKKALGWYSSANCTPIECSTSATLFCGVERRESERRGDGSGTSAPQPQCSAVFEHPQPTVLPYACESSALASATRACGATAPCLSHAPRPAAGRTCRRDVVVSRACHSASHRGTTRGGR